MPNHIKNRLKINGTIQQIKHVFEKYNTHIKSDVRRSCDGDIVCKNDSESNFSIGWLNPNNGIFKTRQDNSQRIGLPDGYRIWVLDPEDRFPDFNKIIPHPDCDEYNDIPSQEAVKNSANWWYRWNIDNWGTKWNSYSHCSNEYGTYTFNTAWNGVPALIQEVSRQNPDIEIEYVYADEDSGFNVGKFIFLNGNILFSIIPQGVTKESYDIYFELNPEDKEYYELIDGNYKYIEEG